MSSCPTSTTTWSPAKDGSEVLARVRSMGFDNHPAMVTWELEGKNRVFALTGEIHTMAYGTWTYYLDFGANLMIYLDGRPVPQDIDLVHSLRITMHAVAIRRSLLMSLLEFCDSFGANTAKITLRIDELDDVAAQARPLYLQLQFEETQVRWSISSICTKGVEVGVFGELHPEVLGRSQIPVPALAAELKLDALLGSGA